MDVELFVHGVPNGEAFWGKDETCRNYMGQFYVECSDEVRFLIQACELKGRRFCFYNYLVYKSAGALEPNVVGFDGRDGSYFGLTLRLDAYCKDVAKVYRILDTIYNVYILGKILKMDKSKLKYVTPDFSGVSTQLQLVETATMQLIQNAFVASDFSGINDFAIGGTTLSKFNLNDCTPDRVLEQVKKCGLIAISPYYPTIKEIGLQQSYGTQIQTVQQQCEAKINAIVESNNREKNDIRNNLSLQESITKQLQQTVLQKEEVIRQQNSRILGLENDLKRTGYSRKVAQIVEPIQKPISELNLILRQICPKGTSVEKRTSDSMKWVKLIPVLNTLLLILLIIFVTAQALDFKGMGLIGGGPGTDARIDSLMCINDRLSEELASVRTEKMEVEELAVLKKYITGIDLEEYNGINFNKEPYTLRPKILGIKWKVENAKLKKDDLFKASESDSPTVEMMPDSGDTVKIYLSINGYEVVNRNIPK